MEQQIKALLEEIDNLRGDINMLALYIKEKEVTTEENIKGVDEDLKSLEKDILKKIQELLKNKPSSGSGEVAYIKNLMSDDFKEREETLIQKVIEIINKIQIGGKKWEK